MVTKQSLIHEDDFIIFYLDQLCVLTNAFPHLREHFHCLLNCTMKINNFVRKFSMFFVF